MNPGDFERVLDRAVEVLTESVRTNADYHSPEAFERCALDALKLAARDCKLTVQPTFHPHAFPDIRANGFGVEVKYTKQDKWLAVGNSIFEGMRDPHVTTVYVLFGKIGGEPEVRWGRYEECVTHVRVSKSPRFVIEMEGDRSSLFEHLKVRYDEFTKLDESEKMRHVREYSRNRLKEGERLWWLEPSHTLPVAVRVYRTLEEREKRELRAEAALLCPEIVRPGSDRGKYDQAGLYLITQHAVFAPQLRDLFSAGSVGARGGKRGHKYIVAALRDIQQEMIKAACNLDERLIEEYWSFSCPPERRIAEWLRMADSHATDWIPSQELFDGKWASG